MYREREREKYSLPRNRYVHTDVCTRLRTRTDTAIYSCIKQRAQKHKYSHARIT